jgi:hypothetical protein
VNSALFKRVSDLRLIMAASNNYRKPEYCKPPLGKKNYFKPPWDHRFLFYVNTLYMNEFDNDKMKVFVQHWLTSKMWNTSKLLNKYYILITNCLISVSDKLRRQDNLTNMQILPLNNFHYIARLCHNLAHFTLLTDSHHIQK